MSATCRTASQPPGTQSKQGTDPRPGSAGSQQQTADAEGAEGSAEEELAHRQALKRSLCQDGDSLILSTAILRFSR